MSGAVWGAGRQARRATARGLAGMMTVTAVLAWMFLPAAGPAGATARAGNIAVTPADSLDWSGYAVTGPTFTSVSGSWIQPSAVCGGRKAQQAAFWVGIDGLAASDRTVEQVGTDSDCVKGTKKHPGGGLYYAWYELFPAGLVVLATTNYPVHVGDALSAGVQVSGGAYKMIITDAGRWTYSTTVTAPGATKNSSAEWIAEAPPVCSRTKCKPQPLADFGSVAFSGISANGEAATATDLGYRPITMTNKAKTVTLATPGSLVGGTAFTITWLAL